MAVYIKGDPVENATSYNLFEKNGSEYTKLAEASEIDFEVSALGLAAGDHTLVVRASASDYTDSDYSNEVVYNAPVVVGVNKFNPNDEDYNPNQYLNEKHEWATRTNFGQSGYVACSGGDLLRAGRIENGEWKPNKSSYVQYYDENKNYVSTSTYAEAIDEATNDYGYIIPSNIAYCRVTVRTDFVNSFMITINEDAAPTEYVPYGA